MSLSVSWPELFPVVALSAALLLAPGAVVLRCWGVDRLAALTYAAPISVALLVVATTVTAGLGRSWTLVGGVAALVLVTAVVAAPAALGQRRRARRVGHDGDPQGDGQGDGDQQGDGQGWWQVIPVAAAAAATLATAYLVFAGGVASPLAIPQMPDVVFHLGAVEWLQRHGSASMLDVYRYAQMDGPFTYPGGFHVLPAVVALWTGLPAAAASHAVLVAVVGLVWPLSMSALARVVLGSGGAVGAAAALLAMLFTAFPFRFLSWGVLWPNLLSNALLPAVVAAALCAFAPRSMLAEEPLTRGRAMLYTGFALVVLAVAQPNALATGAVLAVAVAASALPDWRAALTDRSRRVRLARWVRLPVLLALVVLVWAASTRVIPPAMYAINAHIQAGWTIAVRDSLTLYGGSIAEASAILALVVFGGRVLISRRETRWVATALLAFTALHLVLYAVNGPDVRKVTWLWWNDHYRVLAAGVLLAVLCATAALRWVGQWAVEALASRTRPGAGPVPLAARPSIALAALAVIIVLALRGGIPAHRAMLAATYGDRSGLTSWVLPQEYAALTQLAGSVPAGSVVAANPFRGGMFFYIAGGVELLFPTEKAIDVPDRRLIGANLNRVQALPDVCQAVRRQRVDFVLTGGDMHVWGRLDHAKDYAGIDAIATSADFPVVATAGPYTLRSVPSCRS